MSQIFFGKFNALTVLKTELLSRLKFAPKYMNLSEGNVKYVFTMNIIKYICLSIDLQYDRNNNKVVTFPLDTLVSDNKRSNNTIEFMSLTIFFCNVKIN